MIEIAVLIFGTRALAKVAKSKGHSGWLAAIFPVFWVVGELFGVAIGVLATDDVLAGVGLGLVGAIICGIVGAVIIHAIPARDGIDGRDTLAQPQGLEADRVQNNVWAG